MAKKNKPLLTKSKVWIEDLDGNVVFGSGRLKIFKAIKRNGSINAAAKELKMGYRAVWARISATEQRLGQKLLIKQSGGSSGGGSQLTPLAEALIENYEKVQQCVEKETDERFQDALGTYL
ncbi:MAG: LysR family transcriptional regulator, partial [Candidatus Magnetomorum sp.]|nr:LysR family transcriptional regulator [Candidatus Magnetomorum sp.]